MGSERSFHIVIVGGGISGLATAFRLQQKIPTAEITVLEAGPRLGGTIWTERCDGFQFEVGANGFLDTKPSTLELCRQLGIERELLAASDAVRHRFLFLNGRLQRLPESLWSLLRTPLLSWRSKRALLTERFRRPLTEPMDESVHEFVARRTNAEIAEVFADALVTGIHAGDPHLLSMAAAFPRIVEFERAHGSVMKGMKRAARQRRAEAAARGEPYHRGGRLLSFRPGLRLLIETLASRLGSAPICGERVTAMARGDDGQRPWLIHGEGGRSWPADVVVLACPAHRQADIVAALDAELAERMRQIPYVPVVVAALGYRREDVPIDLNGFGYIAPQRTRRDLLGVQWCSSIFPDRAPAGMVLLRALAGGWHRRDVMDWDDGRLLAAVRAELRVTMGIQAAPVFHRLVRWECAIPQYTLGHLERVAGIEAAGSRHAGLFLTGNAYHGVGLNDCTEQAEGVAERVQEYLLRDGEQRA